MAFGGPDEKCLLHEVARVGLVFGQAERKTVERRVMRIDQLRENLMAHYYARSCTRKYSRIFGLASSREASEKEPRMAATKEKIAFDPKK
jgi:hypothetical protein